MRIIGGRFKKTKLVDIPKNNKTLRPTYDRIKENIFNLITNKIEGANFLDLFAGCGNIGIEAISRGAKYVTFVENTPKNIALIKKNIENLKIKDKTNVVRCDVSSYLEHLSRSYALRGNVSVGHSNGLYDAERRVYMFPRRAWEQEKSAIGVPTQMVHSHFNIIFLDPPYDNKQLLVDTLNSLDKCVSILCEKKTIIILQSDKNIKSYYPVNLGNLVLKDQRFYGKTAITLIKPNLVSY